MIGKLIVILTIAIATVFAASYQQDQHQPDQTNAVNGSDNLHHLIIGSRAPDDKLVYEGYISRVWSYWQVVVTVQKTYNINPSLRITQVQVLDQDVVVTGGYATLVNGGPGFNNVTILFTSRPYGSIKFNVDIYAH